MIWKKKHKDPYDKLNWHRWFAWHPVHVRYRRGSYRINHYAWFCFILRRERMTRRHGFQYHFTEEQEKMYG